MFILNNRLISYSLSNKLCRNFATFFPHFRDEEIILTGSVTFLRPNKPLTELRVILGLLADTLSSHVQASCFITHLAAEHLNSGPGLCFLYS